MDRVIEGVTFQPQYCGSRAQLSNGNKRVTKNNASGWNCAALGTKCTRYKIRMLSGNALVMIGFATTAINKDGPNYSTANIYYLHTSGNLYCKDQGKSGEGYGISCNSPGSTIEAILENNTIRYVLNGTDFGVAFGNVTGDLYPAFDIHGANTSFEFVYFAVSSIRHYKKTKMHTWKNRVSSLSSYSMSVIGVVVCVLAASSYLVTAPPSAVKNQLDIKSLVKLTPLRHRPFDSDGALFRFDLKADMNPLFNWNVKQIFIYLSVEYTTEENVINQVVLWDTLIGRWELDWDPKDIAKAEDEWKSTDLVQSMIAFFTRQKPVLSRKGRSRQLRQVYHKKGVLSVIDEPNKYVLADDGNFLRGKNLTFKLNWNVVPNAGFLFDQSLQVGSYELPHKYVVPKKGQHYKATDEI